MSFKVIPYSAATENVAYNQGYNDPATQVVKSWLQSSGHRQNIEGQYKLTGVGIAKNARGEYYFSQIFRKLRDRLKPHISQVEAILNIPARTFGDISLIVSKH